MLAGQGFQAAEDIAHQVAQIDKLLFLPPAAAANCISPVNT